MIRLKLLATAQDASPSLITQKGMTGPSWYRVVMGDYRVIDANLQDMLRILRQARLLPATVSKLCYRLTAIQQTLAKIRELGTQCATHSDRFIRDAVYQDWTYFYRNIYRELDALRAHVYRLRNATFKTEMRSRIDSCLRKVDRSKKIVRRQFEGINRRPSDDPVYVRNFNRNQDRLVRRFRETLGAIRKIQADADEFPNVFISYAWGEKRVEDWVRGRLYEDLRRLGFDDTNLHLDVRQNTGGKPVPSFTDRILEPGTIVFYVASREMLKKHEGPEPSYVKDELFKGSQVLHRNQEAASVVFLLLDPIEAAVPRFARARVPYNFCDKTTYFTTFLRLTAEILFPDILNRSKGFTTQPHPKIQAEVNQFSQFQSQLVPPGKLAPEGPSNKILGQMPDRGADWIDRPADVQAIRQVLEKDSCRLVEVVGLGGMGKSSLIGHFVENVEHVVEYDRVIWFSFYHLRSLDVLGPFRAFLKFMLTALQVPATKLSTREQWQLVSHAMVAQPYLVILDGFEVAQVYDFDSDISNNPRYGQILDPELRLFLQYVAGARRMQSRVIITTRVRLTDMNPGRSAIQELMLEKWTDDDIRRYFLGEKVPTIADRQAIDMIIRKIDGHPLCLAVYKSALYKFYGGDLALAASELLDMLWEDLNLHSKIQEKAYREQCRRLARILEQVATKLPPDQKQFMVRLCLMDGELSDTDYPLLVEPDGSRRTFVRVRTSLIEKGLIVTNSNNITHHHTVTAHPMVKWALVQSLESAEILRHRAAILAYYQSIEPPALNRPVEAYNGLMELCHQLTRILEIEGTLQPVSQLLESLENHPYYRHVEHVLQQQIHQSQFSEAVVSSPLQPGTPKMVSPPTSSLAPTHSGDTSDSLAVQGFQVAVPTQPSKSVPPHTLALMQKIDHTVAEMPKLTGALSQPPMAVTAQTTFFAAYIRTLTRKGQLVQIQEEQLRTQLGSRFFGSADWERLIGKRIYLGKIPVVPADIFRQLDRPCPIAKDGRRVGQTHFLFFMPQQIEGRDLTVPAFRKFVNISSNRPQSGAIFLDSDWEDHFFTADLQTSQWVLVPMIIANGTYDKTYSEQVRAIDAYPGYMPIEARLFVAATVLYYLNTGDRFCGEGHQIQGYLPYVRCSDRLPGPGGIRRPVIGHFDAKGLRCIDDKDSYKENDVVIGLKYGAVGQAKL